MSDIGTYRTCPQGHSYLEFEQEDTCPRCALLAQEES